MLSPRARYGTLADEAGAAAVSVVAITSANRTRSTKPNRIKPNRIKHLREVARASALRRTQKICAYPGMPNRGGAYICPDLVSTYRSKSPVGHQRRDWTDS